VLVLALPECSDRDREGRKLCVVKDEICPLVALSGVKTALRNGDLLLCFQGVEPRGDSLPIGMSLAP
jgi:hypothetical protein